MQDTVFYHGNPIKPDDLELIDMGGEGSVFLLNHRKEKLALKILHGWNELDVPISRLDAQQKVFRKKILGIQDKLATMPNLPDRMVKHNGLLYDQKRETVVGVSMPFVGDFTLDELASSKSFREEFTMQQITKILLDLHVVVSTAHSRGLVFGDMTTDNFRVAKVGRFYQNFAVDCDNAQWAKFPSTGFQWDFVDPTLLGAVKSAPGGVDMIRPYSISSDWYSYTVITMQILTMINPYEGPIANAAKIKWKNVSEHAKPLHGLSVFHKDVLYPRAAIPLDRFPDQLVDYWKDTVINGRRGVFPSQLLMQLKWQTCSSCQTVYASVQCPKCKKRTRN